MSAPLLPAAACCVGLLLLLLPPHRAELLPSETSLLPSLSALLDIMDDDESVTWSDHSNDTDSDDFDGHLYMMHLGPPAYMLPMPMWWWRYEEGPHYQEEDSTSPDSVFSDSWEPTTDANASESPTPGIEEPPQEYIPMYSTWPPPERDPVTGNIITPQESNNPWQESRVPWAMPSTSSGIQYPLETEERRCIYGAIGQPVPRQHNVDEFFQQFGQQLHINPIRQLISQLVCSESQNATGSTSNDAMPTSSEACDDEPSTSLTSKLFTWDSEPDS